jgi:large subunit ribosomal protein L2
MKNNHSNPITPGTRFLIRTDRSQLWKGKPVKSLLSSLSSSGGRNNLGRITSRHRGGGHKKAYRLVDFKRAKVEMQAVVKQMEYDPIRSAFIALIEYEDGTLSYILAAHGMKTGDHVVSSNKDCVLSPGNCMPLSNIPVGTVVHNIEMRPEKGGQIARSAGSSARILGKDSGYAQLSLQSSEVRMISLACRATIGTVANAAHKGISYGKAGRVRWLGQRPHVRGVAMNPVDHPHGGGEGKTSGGRHPVSPWGKCAKGKKTRSNKLTSGYIIRRRKK